MIHFHAKTIHCIIWWKCLNSKTVADSPNKRVLELAVAAAYYTSCSSVADVQTKESLLPEHHYSRNLPSALAMELDYKTDDDYSTESSDQSLAWNYSKSMAQNMKSMNLKVNLVMWNPSSNIEQEFFDNPDNQSKIYFKKFVCLFFQKKILSNYHNHIGRMNQNTVATPSKTHIHTFAKTKFFK